MVQCARVLGLWTAVVAMLATSSSADETPPRALQPSFEEGRKIFEKIWGPDEGLGPHFNTRSCRSCHLNGGRGAAPSGPNNPSDSMTVKLGVLPASEVEASKLLTRIISSFPEPKYGQQLQPRSLDGLSGEGGFTITYRPREVQLVGKTLTLRAPILTLNADGHGKLTPGALTSPRIANSLFGLSLLEAIPAADILAKVDVEDSDGDGVSGKPNMVRDRLTNEVRLGRFGWKAGQPTVRQQNAAAFALDLGLSSSLFPEPSGDCTVQQRACRDAARNPSPEVSDRLLDALTTYIGNLPVPKSTGGVPSDIKAGQKLFGEAGCAACHTPSFTTSSDPALPAHLRGKTIAPYTDLLLHDMGPDLADGLNFGVPQFSVLDPFQTGHEWRTQPLWGVSLTAPFLHDGRAETLEQAIEMHGGEAEASRDLFLGLTPVERADIIEFLEHL